MKVTTFKIPLNVKTRYQPGKPKVEPNIEFDTYVEYEFVLYNTKSKALDGS